MTREPKPSPDLEKLASKTAQKMAKECAERMESEESYDFTPAILSALNEAVRRMNEKIALKCEIAVAERTLDWLKCRKVLDDEIDRLTNENKQMLDMLTGLLRRTDQLAAEQHVAACSCQLLHEEGEPHETCWVCAARTALAEKAEPPKAA